MNLSKYVLPFEAGGRTYVYNTVNKKLLLATDTAGCERFNFLAGSERKCLLGALFKPRQELQLQFIPTWACNLRCPFCYVGHQLKSPRETEYWVPDAIQVREFVTRYISKYRPKSISVSFLGGEPTLNPEGCLSLMDAVSSVDHPNVRFNMSTNLSVKLTDTHLELLRRLTRFQVSIDGDEEYHNLRRASVGGSSRNVFADVIENLKVIEDRGLIGKVTVQSAMTEEMFEDDDRIRDFYVFLRYAGVRQENIHFCLATFTERYSDAALAQGAYCSGKLFNHPCCVFRFMSYFAIDKDGVHANYFQRSGSRLGSLGDDLETIYRAYVSYMWRTMPILNDRECVDCPGVGNCWGYCYGSNYMRKAPSTKCNRELLIRNITDRLRESELGRLGSASCQSSELSG